MQCLTYPGGDSRLQQSHGLQHLSAQLHFPPLLPLGRALLGPAVSDAEILLRGHDEAVARVQDGGVLGHKLLEGGHVRLGNVFQFKTDPPLLRD